MERISQTQTLGKALLALSALRAYGVGGCLQEAECNDRNTAIKITTLVFFILMISACSFQLPKTITGKVVNESEEALSDVTVRVCYSGWGWDDYLIWDKSYCTNPVFTDSDGQFVINFSGFLLPWSPTSSSLRLRAEKAGWTQNKSVYLSNTRIVMVNNNSIQQRRAAELRLSQSNFQRRLTDESDGAYYCRVILPQARSIILDYHKEKLSVTTMLLGSHDNNQAIFALRGSAKAVNTFSNEALLKINRQTVTVNMTLMAAQSCPAGIALISINYADLLLQAGSKVELLVPSIRAMFEAEISLL